MPKRRSRKSPLTPEDIMAMADFIADLTPVVGDAKAAYELSKAVKEEDWSTAALAAVGMIPVAGDVAKHAAKRIPRDWQDVPLSSSARSTRQDMPKRFLEEHGYSPLDPGQKPMANTYIETPEGKLQAFTPMFDRLGNQTLETKTFDDFTSLKTLRNWMGY